jgi:hypothetical protein
MASKGTKQLRFGKIQKVIDELTIEREVLKKQFSESFGASAYAEGRLQGQIDSLQNVIEKLEELGK